MRVRSLTFATSFLEAAINHTDFLHLGDVRMLHHQCSMISEADPPELRGEAGIAWTHEDLCDVVDQFRIASPGQARLSARLFQSFPRRVELAGDTLQFGLERNERACGGLRRETVAGVLGIGQLVDEKTLEMTPRDHGALRRAPVRKPGQDVEDVDVVAKEVLKAALAIVSFAAP